MPFRTSTTFFWGKRENGNKSCLGIARKQSNGASIVKKQRTFRISTIISTEVKNNEVPQTTDRRKNRWKLELDLAHYRYKLGRLFTLAPSRKMSLRSREVFVRAAKCLWETIEVQQTIHNENKNLTFEPVAKTATWYRRAFIGLW